MLLWVLGLMPGLLLTVVSTSVELVTFRSAFVAMLVLLLAVMVGTAAAATAAAGGRPGVERMSVGTTEIREVFSRPGPAETKRAAAEDIGTVAFAAAAATVSALAEFRVIFFWVVVVALIPAAATATDAPSRGIVVGAASPRITIRI